MKSVQSLDIIHNSTLLLLSPLQVKIIESTTEERKSKANWFLIQNTYLRSCGPLNPEGLLLESIFFSSLGWSSSDFSDFCFHSMSSAYHRHNVSLSFLGILLYLGSGFRRRLAVDHELRTVFPSVSFAAASAVNTSANRALNSRAHLWVKKEHMRDTILTNKTYSSRLYDFKLSHIFFSPIRERKEEKPTKLKENMHGLFLLPFLWSRL